jgi:phytoene desaturase
VKQIKVIIIGSGVAGMTCAIRLRARGFEVTVFEKNTYPGGKLSDFNMGPYHFDKGPSLFTQPENFRELFSLAGRKLEDYLSIINLKESNRYFFEDGTIVHAYTSPSEFDREIQHKLGEPQGRVLSYLRKSGNAYSAIGSIFLDYPLAKLRRWLSMRVLRAFATVRYWQIFKSVHEVNRSRFKSIKAVQIFDRFATYNGSNPYRAPGMLTMIPHLEHTEGAFYPKGGMISLTQALYRLATELGVIFHFSEAINEIVVEGSTVAGVKSLNNFYAADAVVSNVDVYFTYQKLLNDLGRTRQIDLQERSTSAVVFYWGINQSFPQLDLHSIFFSDDYEREFKELFTNKILPTDPTVYVNITCKKDADHAPRGHENWFVMVNAPAVKGKDWSSELFRLRKTVLSKLTRILKKDVEQCIVAEKTWLPDGIERDTASYLGSLYGTSSNDRLAAFVRHANDSSRYKKLYFCGGSVHPGGGIPLCLKSARLVEQLIVEQF